MNCTAFYSASKVKKLSKKPSSKDDIIGLNQNKSFVKTKPVEYEASFIKAIRNGRGVFFLKNIYIEKT